MGLDLSRPAFGLIPAPSTKLAKPHKCHPPGPWMHFWFWLFGERIRKDSVWRCSCTKVWKYSMIKLHDTAYPGGPVCLVNTLMWVHSDIQDWVARGGRT